MVAMTPDCAVGRAAPRTMTCAFVGLALVTVARVAAVIATPMELHGDEAQYWAWSQSLDWGYYSKPPLVAWVIALTTGVFGDGEWAIRVAAPFAHAVAATFIGLLARDLYGERAGVWAMALYTLMPAITLSSGVMSTDALLLACWAAALFAFHRFITTRAAGSAAVWAAALAATFALGMLAKYAMAYFAIGVALTAIVRQDARAALFRPAGLAAVAASLLLVAPNLVWNASHDFATFAHTADNANWGGPRFRPVKLLEFWADQFVVFGPLTLLFAGAALARIGDARSFARRPTGLFLLSFTLPALALISAQAFINRANANWAAASYIALSVYLAGWLFAEGGVWDRTQGLRRMLLACAVAVAVGVNALTMAILTTTALSPRLADHVLCAPGAPRGGKACAGYSLKRVRGLEATAAAVAARFAQGHDGAPFAALAVDNRMLFHNLDYYLRAAPPPLRIWRKEARPRSYAETVAPLSPADAARGPVLVVSERARDREALAADFATLTLIGEVAIDRGASGPRRLRFYVGEGFAPAPR